MDKNGIMDGRDIKSQEYMEQQAAESIVETGVENSMENDMDYSENSKFNNKFNNSNVGRNPYFNNKVAGEGIGQNMDGSEFRGNRGSAGVSSGVSMESGNPYIRSNVGIDEKPDRSAGADFIKGAVIGAAATWLLTNEKVQGALFKSIARLGGMFQGGIEELKEQYEDAQAEVMSEKMVDTE